MCGIELALSDTLRGGADMAGFSRFSALILDPCEAAAVELQQMLRKSGLGSARIAARSDDRAHNPKTPAVMLTDKASRDRVATARDAGTNDVLVRPIGLERLAVALKLCLLEPRPFIVTAGYVGPDRRRHGRDTAEQFRSH